MAQIAWTLTRHLNGARLLVMIPDGGAFEIPLDDPDDARVLREAAEACVAHLAEVADYRRDVDKEAEPMATTFRPDRNDAHYNALEGARRDRLAGPFSENDYAHARGIFNPRHRALRLAAMRRAEREARCRRDRCGDEGCDRTAHEAAS